MILSISDLAKATGPTPEETSLARACGEKLARLVADKTELQYQVRVEEENGQGETLCIPGSAIKLLKDILTQMALGVPS